MSLIMFLNEASADASRGEEIRIFANQIVSYKKDASSSGTLIQVLGRTEPFKVVEFMHDIDAMLVRGGFKTEANRSSD